jgi:hypothetical protein
MHAYIQTHIHTHNFRPTVIYEVACCQILNYTLRCRHSEKVEKDFLNARAKGLGRTKIAVRKQLVYTMSVKLLMNCYRPNLRNFGSAPEIHDGVYVKLTQKGTSSCP